MWIILPCQREVRDPPFFQARDRMVGSIRPTDEQVKPNRVSRGMFAQFYENKLRCLNDARFSEGPVALPVE